MNSHYMTPQGERNIKNNAPVKILGEIRAVYKSTVK